MIEGVELTARDLEAALGRHGVKKLDPKGQKFDPNFHQAIFEAPDETVPAGTVSQVVQSGWTIGDRVLRPAMVGVSKGGPKAAPREEPAAGRQVASGAPGHPPQRQVDPPALVEQGRGIAGAIRSTPWKASRAGPPRTIASPDSSRSERVGSPRLQAAEAEERRIAERKRHDRRGEVLLVPVLMQAHLGLRVVEIDEAGLRRRRAGRKPHPDLDQPRRHRRPSPAGLGMGRLVAIALSSDTQPSGPQLLIMTEKGLPVRGMRGRNGGASPESRDLVPQRLLRPRSRRPGK